MLGRLLKITVIVSLITLGGNVANAQAKIAYIDFQELMKQMPETKNLQEQINAYSKQFMDQLTAMNTEYQQKGKDYVAQKSTMSDAIRTAKETELADLQRRMESYSNDAQQKVETKTNELAKPLFEKMRETVKQAAQQKGYTYVINTAQVELIVSPPGDNLMNDVKAKLGIK
jgi:outer membrane protein